MSARRNAPTARRSAVAGLVLLAAGWPLGAVATGAQADDESGQRVVGTCNGRTATEVGREGATMVGTSGSDVFITRGAERVDTGAGNDSICVTGTGAVLVNAGPGDDFVGARKHIGKSFVSLGFGDDLFLGGDGNDRVWSQEASNQSSSDDRDEIFTGKGHDYVISGSSAALNLDRVNLGPGDDVLVTYGFAGSASLNGGLGANTYQPLPGEGVSGEWTFDNVTGRASLDGDLRLVWVSFQRFDLQAMHGWKVRFLGSRASERVRAGGTCRVVLKGRAGHDRISVGSEGCNNLPAGPATLLGGPGNDLLYGAQGDDVLRGGRGRDRADGGLGVDRCFAETRVSC
jgi:Ca2+-binding RTX toxin-like protein